MGTIIINEHNNGRIPHVKKIISVISLLANTGICLSKGIMTLPGRKFTVQLYKGTAEIRFNTNKTYEVTINIDSQWFLNRAPTQ